MHRVTKMTYNLQKDFEYYRDNLFATLATLNLDHANIDQMTITDVLQACRALYGQASYDSSSPTDMARHASLRREQMNIRRFWYFYHLLKWRLENA
jgi:hypothetical protein